MEEKKANNAANGKLSWPVRLSYAGGDVACNVVFGMVGTLLTLFYTDYVGVAAATVGLIMLISRFFDGFSDMIMGIIVEKTNSKWGKSRPWILWMSVPYALSAILLFTVPHTMGLVQSVYIFVTYNFCTTVCYTAINLPYGSTTARTPAFGKTNLSRRIRSLARWSSATIPSSPPLTDKERMQ